MILMMVWMMICWDSMVRDDLGCDGMSEWTHDLFQLDFQIFQHEDNVVFDEYQFQSRLIKYYRFGSSIQVELDKEYREKRKDERERGRER